MSHPTPLELYLPTADGPIDWSATLAAGGSLVPLSTGKTSLALLDTFDHRLLEAGWLFGIEAGPNGRQCLCRDDRGRWEAAPFNGSPPVFASGLPAMDCRNPLARLIDVRALLPQLTLSIERSVWRLEGSDGVAQAYWEEERYCLEFAGMLEWLRPRLRITPVKGCQKLLRELIARLRHEAGLAVAETDLYADAVQAAGDHWPRLPDSLPDMTDPELRADAAVKRAARHLKSVMDAQEPGVLAGLDTEFLHDYRVAVRRTRTLLGQLGEVFSARVTERFRRGFADLAQATSAPRDLDVFLLALDGLDAGLPAALQGQLGPLRDRVEDLARKAHQRLDARLRSAAHRRFLTAWAGFLERPPPRRPSAEKARLAIGALVNQRVWKLYRRLLKEGRAITPESPPDARHELRKTAKKLRYQIELFQGLYPAPHLRPLLRTLKRLQGQLGDYQDLAVQEGHLRELAEDLRGGGAPTATLLAMGALLGQLQAEGERQSACLAEQFEEFASHGHRRKFRRLFRPEPPADPSAAPRAD